MKRGITAVSVAIIVVVLVTLLSTITVSSYNSIQNAKKIVFALEISNIQEEIDSYSKNHPNNRYPVGGNVFTLSLNNVTDVAIGQFDGEIRNANNEITLYEVDLLEIDIEDTEYGNKKSEKDVYVLSKDTGKVYYLNGVKYGKMTYYTLTDDLIDINKRNSQNKDEEKNQTLDITTSGYIIKEFSNDEKEIYISNINVIGTDIKYLKYDVGIIPQANAKDYFITNGKNISGDRIRLANVEDITLYVQDEYGNYAVEYVYANSVN